MGYCVGQVAQEKEISTSCTYTYDVVTKLQSAISAGGELGDIGLPIPDLGSAVTILAVLFKTIFALYFLGMLGVACSVCFTLTPAHEYRQVKVLLDAVGYSLRDPTICHGLTCAVRIFDIVHGVDDRDYVRAETTADHCRDAPSTQDHGVVLFIVHPHHVDSCCGHAGCYAA